MIGGFNNIIPYRFKILYIHFGIVPVKHIKFKLHLNFNINAGWQIQITQSFDGFG